MIEVEVMEDSISNLGNRVSTILATYPRFIHSEVLTHRVHSRNSSSSRAIPVETMIKKVKEDPVIPMFMRNRKGMQANEKLVGDDYRHSLSEWLLARDDAIFHAEELMELCNHKQIVNRLLEPFSHITTILTSTEWDNFFSLRITPFAQQEICELATKIKEGLEKSIPNKLDVSQWHLPFLKEEDTLLDIDTQRKVSVARCARVSYLNHDNSKPDINKDIALHDSLWEQRHCSPFEHILTPAVDSNFYANSRGWVQLRKRLEEQ